MTNEDLYFDKGLNYKVIHTNGKNAYKLSDTIIVPFPIIILCNEGNAKVLYNLEPYSISKNSIFCMFPNTSLKAISTSSDLDCTILAFDKDTIIDSTIGFKVEYFGGVFAKPYKMLNHEIEKEIILNLFSTLDLYSKLERKFERNFDFVYSTIRNIIITLAEMTKNDAEKQPFNGAVYTTTDNYFRDFMQLLSQYSKTQHNVAFYADKLCITPKYLNEICRKKTQHTAKEVITRSVIAQIKNALIISGTSVQRIAYDFNFCDQSSFGKYFKKAVGMAPMAFRNKHNINGDNENADNID